MKINKSNHNDKIFVLQGPNFNLLKLKKLPIEKLNKHIKKQSQLHNKNVIIFQTNEEGKAVGKLQKYRKKISGIIFFPGPWIKSGESILDLLNIIKTPYVTISDTCEKSIFKGTKNLYGEDLFKLVSEAFYLLNKSY